MNDSAVDAAIDKTHLRTTKRIVPHVKRHHPNVTEQQIKAVNKTRPKDSYSHDPQRYYYPVFANHRHAFQMDLLEQSHGLCPAPHQRDNSAAGQSPSRERPDTFPAYFLILINVNTRYAHAIPTERKTKEAINEILTEFINAHAITSIVCDDERAFTSKLVLDTLTSHNVSIRIITEQRHSALSIVDRFIRTLRDMNTPTVKSQHQSTHPKYRDFSIKRMNKLLNIYNHTVHGSTNHTPAEMEQDPKLETEYITEKLYQLERRRKQKDFELKPDTYVRYILPKDPHTPSHASRYHQRLTVSHTVRATLTSSLLKTEQSRLSHVGASSHLALHCRLSSSSVRHSATTTVPFAQALRPEGLFKKSSVTIHALGSTPFNSACLMVQRMRTPFLSHS